MRRALLIALALLALTAPIARADRQSRGEEQIHQQLGQACRYPTDASNECDPLDGYHLNEADVARYEDSWVHRAIGLQRQLDEDVALQDALFPHTHNSFNSEAYTPTLSRMDHNQLLSITDQLRLDMRAIEIDVHRSVSVHDGRIGVVACHANENAVGPAHAHVGCTTEEPLKPYLTELRSWLDANPSQLVLLYLENHLEDDPDAHAEAVANIEDELGSLVYRPSASGDCTALPIDESRAALRAGGKQVLLTGDCGTDGWNTWVFERGERWDESGNDADKTFSCTADRVASSYGTDIIRRYEDRTWLSAMAATEGGITASEMSDMVRCGVNLVGFDMLHPDDPRLEALVWSWAPDEPSVPGCALQRGDGRWVTKACGERHRAACYADEMWSVTTEAVTYAEAADACAFAAPWNGWENGRLLAAGGDVWVRWSDVEVAPQ